MDFMVEKGIKERERKAAGERQRGNERVVWVCVF